MHPLVEALRPWSFPAAVVPVLLTGAIIYRETGGINLTEFARALTLGVLVQAASNVNNSFWDFYSGLDVTSAERGECPKTALKHKSILSDGRVSLTQVMMLNIGLLVGSLVLMLPKLMVNQTMAIVYTSGMSLAVFYTAPPFRLKYYALGDIAIFIAFGPLLTYCSIMLLAPNQTDVLWPKVFWHTIPCAMICEAILHGNNGRDINEDLKSGVMTLANLLGFKYSRLLYMCLIGGAYVCVMVIGVSTSKLSMLVVLLSTPIAKNCIDRYQLDKKTMADMPKQTAKLHMAFGLLLTIAVLLP